MKISPNSASFILHYKWEYRIAGNFQGRKLSRIGMKWPFRKLSQNAKTYHRWVRHAQILWRKLSQVALKLQNSWMFSHLKVLHHRVECVCSKHLPLYKHDKAPVLLCQFLEDNIIHCICVSMAWQGKMRKMVIVSVFGIAMGTLASIALIIAFLASVYTRAT